MSVRPRADRWWLPTWRVAAVLLLLGLIMNLGVAVAIARWGTMPGLRGFSRDPTTGLETPPSWYWYREPDDSGSWPGPAPGSWLGSPRELADSARREFDGPNPDDYVSDSRSLRWAPGWSTEGASVFTGIHSYDYDVHRIGFPFGALRFDYHDSYIFGRFEQRHRNRIGFWHDGIDVPVDEFTFPGMNAWVLPIYPQALGLTVNTLFYGACLWGMWLVCTWSPRRRAGRIRRGECPRCRYPFVPGMDLCPECGAPVSAGGSHKSAAANEAGGAVTDGA